MDVDDQAPVRARAEGLIRAPRDLVWNVQAGLEGWPDWNPDVAEMRVLGSIEAGTRFKWKAGGLKIASELREVDPPRAIGWTGRTLGIRAVHVWRFSEVDGGTRVTTEESFAGLLPRLLRGPTRRMLASSLEKGIEALRVECERRRGP